MKGLEDKRLNRDGLTGYFLQGSEDGKTVTWNIEDLVSLILTAEQDSYKAAIAEMMEMARQLSFDRGRNPIVQLCDLEKYAEDLGSK